MKLLVFGASGGVGRKVSATAVERGHSVIAVVREAARLTELPGAEVRVANVYEEAEVKALFASVDVDAVISCLGIKRRSAINLWSEITSPHDFCSATARHIVEGMTSRALRRLVAISAAGVGDSWSHTNGLMRALIEHSNLSVAYRDLERMENVYRASGLDWCAVRPVTLTNGKARSPQFGGFYGLTSSISRSTVAELMLDVLGDTHHEVTRTPLLS